MSESTRFGVEDGFLTSSKPKCANCIKDEIKNNNKLAEYFENYGNNTTIHGVKYVGDRKRTLIEKILWLILLVCALCYCSFMIFRTYKKWKSNPVIISFDDMPTNITEIPFPAVTICPEQKFNTLVYNYTDCYQKQQNGNITKEELEKYSLMSLICTENRYKEGPKTIDRDDLDDLYVSIDNMSNLKSFYYNNKEVEMDDIEAILTEEGVCYTFNSLKHTSIYKSEEGEIGKSLQNDWSLEKGYLSNSNDVFPNKPKGVGYKSGLKVAMAIPTGHFDYLCGFGIEGFKVIIHQPGEKSLSSVDYYRVPLNEEVIVGIHPEMTKTTDDLISYDPSVRNCYFQNEKPLKYFHNYTKKNCELECLAEQSLKKCGCVDFYMPQFMSTPICGSGSIKCVEEVEETLANSFYMSKDLECDCLPGCVTLQYKKDLSQSKLDVKKLIAALGIKESEQVNIASTTIYFKESQFYAVQRGELYSSIDFIANIGGILGLFTGFSILSFMEIIYYITLRPCVNKAKRGKWHINE